jgi:hypothetical protein
MLCESKVQLKNKPQVLVKNKIPLILSHPDRLIIRASAKFANLSLQILICGGSKQCPLKPGKLRLAFPKKQKISN